MTDWRCPACDETNGPGFEVCWNCGTHADGRPPTPDFVRDDAPPPQRPMRALDCLRCGQPMHHLGERRFHEGTLAREVLLGELFVNRERFDVFACGACGKTEFFVEPARR